MRSFPLKLVLIYTFLQGSLDFQALRYIDLLECRCGEEPMCMVRKWDALSTEIGIFF